MDIKDEIQHYITAYDGSEDRVIDNVMSQCRCKEDEVKANIDWLIKYKYIKYIPFEEMSDGEKSYFQSDNCRILRNIKIFDEKEFDKIKEKENEEVNKLSNIEKFKYFFSKMEEEFDRKEFYNEKDYKLTDDTNIITINFKNSNEFKTELEFDETTYLCFMESTNSIYYKMNNKSYEFYLEYMSGKCCLRFCCN